MPLRSQPDDRIAADAARFRFLLTHPEALIIVDDRLVRLPQLATPRRVIDELMKQAKTRN